MITMIPVQTATHLNLEMVGWGPLPAAQLCSQLQAVGEQIVEVLERDVESHHSALTLSLTCMPSSTRYHSAPLLMPALNWSL